MSLILNGKNPESITINGKAVESLSVNGDIVWPVIPSGPDYVYIQNEYNGSNNITIKKVNSPTGGTDLSYSLDGNNWTQCTYDSNGECIVNLDSLGDKVYLRSSTGLNSYTNYYNILGEHDHSVGGDLRTLIDYNVTNPTMDSYAFYCLFYQDLTLISANRLNFSGFTTLARGCYWAMFMGCESLIEVAELPATTLVSYCYTSLYNGCISLTTAPVLPATTLEDYCYDRMYVGCSNLNKITIYAQDISARNCLRNWLHNVAASGDFYNLGGATYPSGASGIPEGWTEHTSL